MVPTLAVISIHVRKSESVSCDKDADGESVVGDNWGLVFESCVVVVVALLSFVDMDEFVCDCMCWEGSLCVSALDDVRPANCVSDCCCCCCAM